MASSYINKNTRDYIKLNLLQITEILRLKDYQDVFNLSIFIKYHEENKNNSKMAQKYII
jgi:hypothetical protein